MGARTFDKEKADKDFATHPFLKFMTLTYFVAVLAISGYALLAIKNETWPWSLFNIVEASEPTEKQIMYAFVGGVIGAAVFAFHGFAVAAGPQVEDYPKWHYDPNWTWWYIAQPPLGGFLGVIAYVITKSGVAQLGTGATDPQSNIGFFAVGALAGFSTKRVLKWLDSRAETQYPGSKGSSDDTDEEKPIGGTSDAGGTASEQTVAAVGVSTSSSSESTPSNPEAESPSAGSDS